MGIYDAISKGDNDANNIGQRVILPSSYTGSARYMLNNYQDAMAICRQYGNPDLFITFTCNVKWPEIVREFNAKPGYKPEDRPDIVSRLFKIKLDDMINYIKSGEPFGEIEAAVDIDSIISAELPDKTVNYDLYDIVTHL
ncbi:transposable element gene [Prunus dulcis]|uniref:Transposable element protein n=1 Tax=Prunus dulcis TaxID=3755 RepID=A0A5H2XMQ9_PRUDU|nr:transposable element gene [Prunus dulcis]